MARFGNMNKRIFHSKNGSNHFGLHLHYSTSQIKIFKKASLFIVREGWTLNGISINFFVFLMEHLLKLLDTSVMLFCWSINQQIMDEVYGWDPEHRRLPWSGTHRRRRLIYVTSHSSTRLLPSVSFSSIPLFGFCLEL